MIDVVPLLQTHDSSTQLDKNVFSNPNSNPKFCANKLIYFNKICRIPPVSENETVFANDILL